jgi:hypothetical protein
VSTTDSPRSSPPLLADYRSSASTRDDEETTVYPAIIVHRRRLQENLLVIEVKKSTNHTNRDRDLKKLMEFVRHPDYAENSPQTGRFSHAP